MPQIWCCGIRTSVQTRGEDCGDSTKRVVSEMSRKTIYFGRFISTPTPDELLIRKGAVLVSAIDGTGVIEKVDWTVNGPNDAISKFGEEVGVVTAGDEGFFFPGFIGGFEC